jgi:hypothetical protein
LTAKSGSSLIDRFGDDGGLWIQDGKCLRVALGGICVMTLERWWSHDYDRGDPEWIFALCEYLRENSMGGELLFGCDHDETIPPTSTWDSYRDVFAAEVKKRQAERS